MERNYFRGTLRFVGLFATLAAAWLHGCWVRPQSLRARCLWRQRWCRTVLRVLGIHVDLDGTVPEAGLLVSNHLGYLDVLVLGALSPAVFVSKAEVKRWPLVGPLCTRGGTLYLQRESARDAVHANRGIASVLKAALPVVVFPEGTTTDGGGQLPFRPALFHAAVAEGAPVWPLALSYWFADGSRGCCVAAYAGDATFLPHLFRICSMPPLRALVQAAASPVEARSRGDAANDSAGAVQALLQYARSTSSAGPAIATA